LRDAEGSAFNAEGAFDWVLSLLEGGKRGGDSGCHEGEVRAESDLENIICGKL
jgi:hypothetical protein